MADSITLESIYAQIVGLQETVRSGFTDVKAVADRTNERLYVHETRLSTVEARQAIIMKVVMGTIGGGGVVGGGLVYTLFQVLG